MHLEVFTFSLIKHPKFSIAHDFENAEIHYGIHSEKKPFPSALFSLQVLSISAFKELQSRQKAL